MVRGMGRGTGIGRGRRIGRWVIVQYIGYGHCSRYGETGTYFVYFKYLIPD